eukprot:TRINITY_DN1282_c0_g2_i2.p1 TRINITY_DN1282_c0_g2~~TRINITY_DN1282_c0_g2_i2.p1  ORF type:complete len:218 (+),score=27.75 TRINITY_DN1282_c0_g2_i2:307-960(+)
MSMFQNVLISFGDLFSNNANASSRRQESHEVWFTVRCFFFFAAYRLCFWLYCVTVAIPKTGSNVLVALANDNRNDFLASLFIITSVLLAELGNTADSADSLASLALSVFVIYTWMQLLQDQIDALCQTSVEPTIIEPLVRQVQECLASTSCEAIVVKAYYSTPQKYIVEIELGIGNASLPADKIQNAVSKLQCKLGVMPEVERVIVTTRLQEWLNLG